MINRTYREYLGNGMNGKEERYPSRIWIDTIVLMISTFMFFFILSLLPLAHAQVNIDEKRVVSGGQELTPTDQSKDKLAPKEPGFVLPPLPPSTGTERNRLPLLKVFVREIKIIGSTVLSSEEKDELTASYINRDLRYEDLEALRRKITVAYVNKGYINSGAIISDQEVVNGVIVFRVIEGELTHVTVEGNKRLHSSYIEKRIALGADSPLNVKPLQERLQMLQQDIRIKRVNAELTPGIRLGESELEVKIEEERPYEFFVTFDNYTSPTVGGEKGRLIGVHRNLLGFGDTLNLTVGRSEGIDHAVDASYTIPITARDTTISLEYRKNDFTVIEEPFEPLDALSRSDIYGVTLRHPVYRTNSQEFALALTGEHLKNETFLLGEGFSFALGADRGKSDITALRFSQEWTYQSEKQVFAVHSRFSFGIDALDATIHDSGLPDGEFFSWLGQFQWVRRMDFWDSQLIFKTDIQLSEEPLLPLEQIAVGGRYSVRGYRENLLVRDNGLIASVEFRIPVVRDKPWADLVQLAPFFDFGRAWKEDTHTPHPKNISSVGLGLRWELELENPIRMRPRMEIYWGEALRDIERSSDDDLQDDGIHFQFVMEF